MKREEIERRKKWLAYWEGAPPSRIEPSIGSTPGFPDCFLAWWGENGLVEFKALDGSGCFTFEPSQRLWMVENYEHCSIGIALCLLDHDGFWLLPASSYRALVEVGLTHCVYDLNGVRKVKWSWLDAQRASLPSVLLDLMGRVWRGER